MDSMGATGSTGSLTVPSSSSTSGVAGDAETTAAGADAEATDLSESSSGAESETSGGAGETDETATSSSEAPASDPTCPPGDRALAALAVPDGVYLSWRWLADDPEDIAFHVYRTKADGAVVRVTDEPVTQTTDFIDRGGALSEDDGWYITCVLDGGEDPTPSASAWRPRSPEHTYFERSTGSGGHGRSLAMGDLLGRGQMDFVLRHSSGTIDPYYSLWERREHRYTLHAFDHDGNLLWKYAMGESIEPGIWYSPYLVYDLDQDGDAELIVKAGDESLGPEELQDESGRVLYGPEYLRIIDGHDGQTVLAQVDWPNREGYRGADPPDTPLEERRYEDYNRQSRNLMAIAYLDGEHPYVVVLRGTYGKLKAAAYRYDGGTLHRVWSWENEDPYALTPVEAGEAGYEEYRREYERMHRWWGQGAHSLRAADIDGDGRDEVILGAIALDDDGTPLWSMNRGHVDHVHLGDLDPQRPGLELYFGTERSHDRAGIGMAMAETGEFLWTNDWATSHIHREGMCADIDARHPGTECYSGESERSGHWLFTSAGRVLQDTPLNDSLTPKAAYWDADPQRELLVGSGDASDELLVAPTDYASGESYEFLTIPNDTESRDHEYVTLLAVADILGDWREELIYADRGRILVYMSRIPAESRHVWLMQDPVYRSGVTVGSMGYYQQPLLGYDLQTERETR